MKFTIISQISLATLGKESYLLYSQQFVSSNKDI